MLSNSVFVNGVEVGDVATPELATLITEMLREGVTTWILKPGHKTAWCEGHEMLQQRDGSMWCANCGAMMERHDSPAKASVMAYVRRKSGGVARHGTERGGQSLHRAQPRDSSGGTHGARSRL